MEKSTNYKSAAFGVRLAAVAILLTATTFLTVTAFMQGKSEQAVPAADQFGPALSDPALKELSIQPEKGGAKSKGMREIAALPGPNAVTAITYPFTATSAVALEDMSSGTTQLLAASQDDTASALTNIGFDFWFDGVRQTQFSVNANGLMKLGAPVVNNGANGRTNNFATANDLPKLAAYWDDLCTSASGKVHFKVIGSPGSRRMIVEWQNMVTFGPSNCTDGLSIGTFQLWIFESSHPTSPGIVQFVYGAIGANSALNSGYSNGIGSAAASFASVTTATDTVSYATSANAQINTITAGKSYLFTPNIPLAPGGAGIAPITPTSLQLNWVDNATNEVGYAIYRSTDNVNFSFITQTAANAVSFNDTGLTPSTQYFYLINAVTEGALSTNLALSATTAPAGNDTCLGAGGNWDAPGTWTDGSVPTVGDNVTIGTGCTVTVNVTNAVALNVTVDSGGTLQSPTTGAVITNNLTASGSVTNNGTLDFSTNGDTSAAILTFGAGAPNVAFGGSGAITDVRAITVAKGAQATVVDLTVSNLTVRGVNTDVAGYLTLTSGTFKISGSFTMTNRTFITPAYVIPALGGFWLNNLNYTVAGTASGTTSGNSGLLRLTQGIYTIGLTAADGFQAGGATGTYIFEGGTLNANGRFDPQATTNYTQSAGTVNVAIVGNSVSAFGSFEIFATASTFNMSGGTINLINPATGATKDDYVMRAQTRNITGGTVVFGGPGAPAASTYSTPFGNTFIPSFTVNTGMTYNINAVRVLLAGPTLTNNGSITSTGAAQFDFFATAPMTYSGTGTFGTLAAPFATIASNSLSLATLNSPIVTNRVNLFQGGFVNSNQITLGNAGASTTVVQIGSTGLTTAGGSFDVSPVHNQGTGGEILLYAFETVPRTTGVEINPTRILTSMLVDNPNTLTIAGGDLTLSSAAAAATMTNGRIITGANTLILSSGTATVTRTNGYVDGNFRKTFAAAANKNFEVGTANGYSPAAVNVTAGTFPATVTVKAVQGPQPNIPGPGQALSRYWTLTATGLTAGLTFNYLDPTDIPVTATEANFVIQKYDGAFTQPGGTVTTATNVANITGVSAITADWTLAEPGALTPGSLQFSSPTYSVAENVGGGIATITVTRTGGTAGAASINYATSNGTANGGVACGANVDYVNASGTLNWADGDGASKTFNVTICNEALFEGDETVNLALTGATGASAGAPATAVLTITNDDPPTPPNAGDLIISEFRLRGSGGVDDEFIEIYNDSGADLTVQAADASAGLAVAASDGVARCVILNGTVIRAGGHFLCTNAGAYSLAGYPAGSGTFATPDLTYALSITDNAGIAIFNNATGGASFSLANRLDAVGSASETNLTYKEGTGYPDLNAFDTEYSVFRNLIGGLPQDTDDNLSDFVVGDTEGFCKFAGGCSPGATAQRLGAPGPENLSSPIQRNATVKSSLIDNGCASSSGAGALSNTTCARHRDATPGAAPVLNGTLSIRRTFKNNTGAPVTRLRFRAVDLTTFVSPAGTADLRLLTSSSYSATCVSSGGGCAGTGSVITIEGTALETPPAQPNGGGLNSSMSAGTITLATPLVPGASINLQFLLGVQQNGSYRFFINVEALP